VITVSVVANARETVRPPLKWAGGKSQLLKQYTKLFPEKVDFLIEPFVGSGAVFFCLRPSRAVILDSNEDLISFYRVLRDKPEPLLAELLGHQNTEEYYYKIRALDTAVLNDIQRASRFLFLNKTAYNGLWRVNRKGQHNVPFGRYKNPNIADENNLRKASALLQRADIRHGDFSCALDVAEPKFFIYLDPPYDPLTQTANFTSYTAASFAGEDQRRLAGLFRELDSRGCRVMLSNSDTPFIRDLYSGYDITVVTARRSINCRANGRSPVNELVIRNY